MSKRESEYQKKRQKRQKERQGRNNERETEPKGKVFTTNRKQTGREVKKGRKR